MDATRDSHQQAELEGREDEDSSAASPGAGDQVKQEHEELRAEHCPPALDFDADSVAHVYWEDLIDGDRAQSRAAFADSLHKLGFAFLSLPDSMMGNNIYHRNFFFLYYYLLMNLCVYSFFI